MERKNHPFEVGLSPRLIGAELADRTDVSDGFEIPRILRNKGIRVGAAITGQALTVGGAAVAARGYAKRNRPVTPRRYESVRKSQLRKKGLKPQKGISYLPEADRRVNRWQQRRLANTTKPPVPRGTMQVRLGGAMMVAGRLMPYIAVGYIAYDIFQSDMDPLEYADNEAMKVQDWTVGQLVTGYNTANAIYVIGKGFIF